MCHNRYYTHLGLFVNREFLMFVARPVLPIKARLIVVASSLCATARLLSHQE